MVFVCNLWNIYSLANVVILFAIKTCQPCHYIKPIARVYARECHENKITRFWATYMVRSGLLQLAICRLVTICWNKLQQACWINQLATSLLTTCNRLVVTSCCKPCERILISASCKKLSQDVNRLVTTCRFWLCRHVVTFIICPTIRPRGHFSCLFHKILFCESITRHYDFCQVLCFTRVFIKVTS